jgi:hypothetical protein
MKLLNANNWKNGKIFFYLAILFLIIIIGILYVDIHKLTQHQRPLSKSTLWESVAMMFAFLAIGMTYFSRFFKTKLIITQKKNTKIP